VGEANRALSLVVAVGKLRNLVTLLAGVKEAYELEGVDSRMSGSIGSKYMLGCSFLSQASVTSDPAQQLTFLLGEVII
jgi:hypothetical protein